MKRVWIILPMLVIAMLVSIQTNNSKEVFGIDLTSEIQERGHPGMTPDPNLLQNSDSFIGLPRVSDWAAPIPQSPVVGTRRILAILVDFPDHAGSHTQLYYQNLLFGGTSGTLSHYYTETSYGMLSVTGSIAGTGWSRSIHNEDWWGDDYPPGLGRTGNHIDDANQNIFELAREAIVAADASVDFNAFDTDDDNILDPNELSLCIVHAGSGQESTGTEFDIWSHRWYVFGAGYDSLGDTYVDGIRISKHPDDNVGGYFMQAEDSPMGTFAHEFGHDIGLPDLYDTDYSSNGVGDWSLMAHGSWLGSGTSPAHLDAWSRAKMGWVMPILMKSSSVSATVNQIETSATQSLYRFSISSNEYFLIENREKVGYDSQLPGAGILIWHIDESRTNNNDENHKMVDLEEADGLDQLDKMINFGDSTDPWYSPHATNFADATMPNSHAYDGSLSLFGVTHTSITGISMTANFEVGTFAARQVPAKIFISTLPKLPALATTYSSVIKVQLRDMFDDPVPAPFDLLVSLSSSNLSVGEPSPDNVRITAGYSLAYASFTTTYLPGSTSITATAHGLTPGVSSISTQSDNGFDLPPAKLTLTIAPDKLPSTGASFYCIKVELQDQNGNPTRAYQTVGVVLKSSAPSVAAVPATISIPAGSTFSETYIDTTPGGAGSATITATSVGYGFALAVVQIVPLGGSPTILKLCLAPNRVIAQSGTYYYPIIVQLRDTDGNPSSAPTGGISVSLSSSDTSIGTIPSLVAISQGESYARTYFTSTNKVGSTLIVATATGYTSDSGTLYTQGFTPTKLRTYLAPPKVRANAAGEAYPSYNYYVVAVQLEDDTGHVAKAPEAVGISLSSSDTSIGTVTTGITITEGTTFSYATFTSTFKPGNTLINAASTLYESSSASMSTIGPIPTQVAVILAPERLPATGATFYCLRVQLQDANGNPARAPSSISVSLGTSNSLVAAVPPSVTIGAGSSFSVTYIDTTPGATGTATISATATGYTPGAGVIHVTDVGGAPTKLVTYASPSRVFADGVSKDVIVVQLRDDDELPSLAPYSIGISLISSNPEVGTIISSTAISNGENFLRVSFGAQYSSGVAMISVTSSDLASSNARVMGSQWFPEKTVTLSDFPYIFHKKNFAFNNYIILPISEPHGPCGAAHTMDTMGGVLLANTLGLSGVAAKTAMDSYAYISTYDFSSARVTMTDVTSNLIVLASPGVNQVAYYYNELRDDEGSRVLPVIFLRDAGGDYLYVQNTGHTYRIEHVGGTTTAEYGVMQVYGDGNRFTLIVYGLGGESTMASARILQEFEQWNLSGKAAIVKYYDSDEDGFLDTSQIVEVIP